jgi:hypothetical protein
VVQPNSYAHERNYIPHDPDEKDRELDLEKERYLPNSHDLDASLTVWFPEKKLMNLLPEARVAMLGPDHRPWNGWAKVASCQVRFDSAHPQQSRIDIILRFEHSGQALAVEVPANTPWVVRR